MPRSRLYSRAHFAFEVPVPRHPSHATLLLLALFALAACGKDSDKKSKVTGAATTTTTPAVQGTCENTIAFDQAPTRWLRVNPDKLVDGTAGTWELAKTQLHGALERGGIIQSAAVSAVVLDHRISPDIVLKVACQDLAGGESFSLGADPQITIARANGAYSQKMDFQFKLLGEDSEELMELKMMAEAATFSAGEDDAKIREKGGTLKYRLYKISATEYELRSQIVLPGEQGGKLTLSVASRYKLKG